MDKTNKKFYRYQMTFPFEGHKIYKSRSFNKVVDKCYTEFKKFNDIGDGMFCVTNLDKEVEYQFKVKNKKIYKVKSKQNQQSGGQITDKDRNEQVDNQVKELSRLDEDVGDEPQDVNIMTSIRNVDVNVNTANKNLTGLTSLVQTTNKNVGEISGKIDEVKGITQQINAKIEKSPKTITVIQQKPSPELKDVFEDVDDVFGYRLRELSTMKKIESLEEKYSNTCTIL